MRVRIQSTDVSFLFDFRVFNHFSFSLSQVQLASVMPFSDVDRHAIEVLVKEKGWGASRIVQEFPNKGWHRTTVNDLVRKIKETGSSDRLPGSGHPRTALTDENCVAVIGRSMSDPARPRTSQASRTIATELEISQSSVIRIRKEVGMKTFTRIITPRIGAAAVARRSERAEALYENFTDEDIPMCVFYDEKDLTLERPINRQTDKVCSLAKEKRNVSPERLFHQRSRFSRKIMVCGAVSYRGKSKLQIVDPQQTKVDSDAYQAVLRKLFPSIRRLYPEDNWIFIQDSAPSHRSASTQDFLMHNTPRFIPSDQWPPHSPDCNPLDYHVWNELREKVYRGRSEPFESLDDLAAAAKEAWKEIPLEHIQRSIDRFLPRLRSVAEQDGGPIQHMYR